MNDNDLKKLLHEFNRPWKGYRKVRKGVMKRIKRHMRNLGCTTLTSYLTVLEENREEYAICQACLRVTISRFFRDKQLWSRLDTEILPLLLDRFPGKLELWSAGCASGEEAYSLAMLLGEVDTERDIKIIATDADNRCLERARIGIYGESSLREMSQEQIQEYFSYDQSQDEYTITPLLQDKVVWLYHNLFDPPPKSGFHLILLRNNLLTYYCEPLLSQVLDKVTGALLPGGYLIIGSHETLPPGCADLLPWERHPCVYEKQYPEK